MKKRIISVLLILSVATAAAAMAAGCGKKPADGTDKDSNGGASQEGTGSGGRHISRPKVCISHFP